jgi:hypothetical protein
VSALAEALVAAQAELPCAIGKDADGQIGNRDYRYLTLDKLIAETRPILTKHGLTILQFPAYQVIDGKTFPTLVTRVELAADPNASPPDFREYAMPLYVEPKTMQGLGSAITYARRYAWQSVLGIAAEEDTDAAKGDPLEEDVRF